MAHTIIVEERYEPMPKVLGRGRKKGRGINKDLIRRMKVGGPPLFGIPRKKAVSLYQSAYTMGARLKMRRIPDSTLYALQRIQ